MLVDKYGRPLTHLRISVTYRCNYRCIFCHGEGLSRNLGRELTASEIELICRAARQVGIKYVKLTGGEPLLRSDIEEIVGSLAKLDLEVSMATNGYRLAEVAEKLVEAGLARINVNIPSLKSKVYREITGGTLENVLEGLREVSRLGIPVTINFVVLKQTIGEFNDMLSFCEKHGFKLRLIELIPLGMPKDLFNALHVPLSSLENTLEREKVRKYFRDFQFRPVFVMPSGIEVEIVRGFGNPELCAKCTRIRLTPDGKLKNCLYRNDKLVDLKPILESDLSEDQKLEKLVEAFVKANSLREPFFK